MANRFNRSIREIRDIEKQPLHTNEQNDLLSDINDDVYVRLRRRYERITGLPALEKKFNNHLIDYNQFKDDTQSMLIYLNNENERQDMMIDKLNTDVDDLIKKAKRLKDISDEHTEELKTLTNELNEMKIDVESNRENMVNNVTSIYERINQIAKNDKQDKLQSEIDELRKTIETIKSDAEESQAIEDLKSLSEDMKNFVSVASNLTQNVAGQNDMIYFDVYLLDTSKQPEFKLLVQKLENGMWSDSEEVTNINFTISQITDTYYSVGYDISKYENVVLFNFLCNDRPIYVRQVTLSE